MTATYEFDADFQNRILAFSLRDQTFAERTEGLIKSEFFDSYGEAYLADLHNGHFGKYRQAPAKSDVLNEIRKEVSAARLKGEQLELVKSTLKNVYGDVDLSNRDYLAEEVEKFAKRRAIEVALLQASEVVAKGGDPEDTRSILSQALDVGQIDGLGHFDLGDSIEDRIDLRTKALTNPEVLGGITTGFPKLDKCLYGNGMRRGEVVSLMGGPKSGKSIGLMNFGINAWRAGYNVLFLSCENSAQVTGDRMDAYVGQVPLNDIATAPGKIRAGYSACAAKRGIFKVHEFPTYSMTCADVRRLLKRYQSMSVKFDLVVIDYADIMTAHGHFDSERAKLTAIWGGVRAIAQEEHIAVLTATQTNREGAKAAVASKTDVAEDINKTRLVDAMISINSNDDEKRRGEMRLYFAAMRNAEEGYALVCKTAYDRMTLITEIVGRA